MEPNPFQSPPLNTPPYRPPLQRSRSSDGITSGFAASSSSCFLPQVYPLAPTNTTTSQNNDDIPPAQQHEATQPSPSTTLFAPGLIDLNSALTCVRAYAEASRPSPTIPSPEKVIPLLPFPSKYADIHDFFEIFEERMKLLGIDLSVALPFLEFVLNETDKGIISHIGANNYVLAKGTLLEVRTPQDYSIQQKKLFYAASPAPSESVVDFAVRFLKLARRANVKPDMDLFVAALPADVAKEARFILRVETQCSVIVLATALLCEFPHPILKAQRPSPPPLPAPPASSRLNALSVEEKKRRMELGLCNYCGEKGHVASSCPPLLKKLARQNSTPSQFDEINSHHNYLPVFKFSCNSRELDALADSGATESFLSLNVLQEMALPLYPVNSLSRVILADGSKGPVVLGRTELTLSLQGYSFTASPLVIRDCGYQIILGNDFLRSNSISLSFSEDTITLKSHLHPELSIKSPIPTKFSPNSHPIHTACVNTARTSAIPHPLVERISHKAFFKESNDLPIFCITPTNLPVYSQPPPSHDKSTRNRDPQKSPLSILEIDHFLRVHLNSTTTSTPKVELPPAYADFADVFNSRNTDTLPISRPNFDLTIRLIDPKDQTIPDSSIYQLSTIETDALKAYIDEMLAKGHISRSRASGGAPVFFVKKKNGALRLCVDYRRLNAKTVRDAFPIPLPRVMFDTLARNKPTVFTKIDLKSAFNLLRVNPADAWKSSFKTIFGLFQYEVVPFGLANAPPVFQRFMEAILSDLLGKTVLVYIDDILIFSPDHNSHTQDVRQVLRLLRENGLTAQLDKSAFSVTHVEFLGFRLSSEGISMDKDKANSILEWKPPIAPKDLARYLGIINFYRPFLRGLSHFTKPLHELARSHGRIKWTPVLLKNFLQTQQLVADHILLTYPNFNGQFFVLADASDFAVGAVLCQSKSSPPIHTHLTTVPTDLMPVGIFSRTLSKHEFLYDTADKEFLAIHSALLHFKSWIQSSPLPIIIFNDHKNLEDLSHSRKFSKRLFRWSSTFAEFNTHFAFVSSKENIVADAISRAPHLNSNHKFEPISLIPAERITLLNAVFLCSNPDIPSNQFALTPDDLFAQLNNLCRFDFDPCPSNPPFDAFHTDWGFSNFVNPPYNKITEWIDRAMEMASRGKSSLMLLPARLESAYFYKKVLCFPTLLLHKRIHFPPFKRKAPFASVLVPITPLTIQSLDFSSTRIFSSFNTPIETFLAKYYPCVPISISLNSIHTNIGPPDLNDILAHIRETTDARSCQKGQRINDGLIYDSRNRIIVSDQEAQVKLVSLFHNASHGGIKTTTLLLARHYWWRHLPQSVKRYINGCQICPRIKPDHTAPAGLLMPLDVPERAFDVINMDHITGLPKIGNIDAILVIRCARTKIVKLIPASTTDTAENLAQQYFDVIFSNYGRPSKIISDRGPTFIASFWRSLMNLIGIKLAFSSGYHAQTNGGAEVTNRSLEVFLRLHSSHDQTNWLSNLRLIEFQMNSAPKKALGNISPFKALYGFDPILDFDNTLLSTNLSHESNANQFLSNWQNTRNSITQHLTKAKEVMIKYANRSRSEAPNYKVNDMVYLRNLNLPIPSSKLSDKYVGPFPIIQVINRNAVTLKLPPLWKVHPTFNVSFLKPHVVPSHPSQNIDFTLPPPVTGQDIFEVEDIIAFNKKNRKYLVKWLGYPIEEATWEKETNLRPGASTILDGFIRRNANNL